MIASLPMYDRPEIAAATDRLWAGIRDHLRADRIAAPDRLTRHDDIWAQWTAPNLVLSQTCGLPYRAHLRDKVTLIGAPVHADMPAGMYHSVIIARPGPLPDAPRLAVNDALSQSGWANLHDWLMTRVQPHGSVMMSGAHRASVQAVAEGRADLAAIDVVTWGFIQRFDDMARALEVLDTTPPVPALPFIAPAKAEPARYGNAIAGAIAELRQQDRDDLNLHGLQVLPITAYLDLPNPPPPA